MSHNRSLPEDSERFERMLVRNTDLIEDGLWATEVDYVFALADGYCDTIWWTAPKQMEPGGTLLLHLREPSEEVPGDWSAIADSTSGHLAPNLRRARLLAELYGGTVFAAARIGSIPDEVEPGRGDQSHSVLLNLAHVFENPLSVERLRDEAGITIQGGLFTRLEEEGFRAVREALARDNELPEFIG